MSIRDAQDALNNLLDLEPSAEQMDEAFGTSLEEVSEYLSDLFKARLAALEQSEDPDEAELQIHHLVESLQMQAYCLGVLSAKFTNGHTDPIVLPITSDEAVRMFKALLEGAAVDLQFRIQ